MRRLIPLGRTFLGIALVGWGIQNFSYHTFVLGRAPAWPNGWPGESAFVYPTGVFFAVAGLAAIANRAVRPMSLIGAAIVLVWALARGLIAFLPHFNTGGQFTDVGKALTLFGGLVLLAGASAGNATPSSRDSSERGRVGDNAEDLPAVTNRPTAPTLPVWVARVCLGIFLFDCGVQHFLWAQYVAPLVPTWVGHAMFWTYAAGVFLVAGGVGLILPWTARPAAACSGLMIFLWFAMLHVPRTVALPHSYSDWLAVFESLGFSGIAFMIAGLLTPQAISNQPSAVSPEAVASH